MNTSQNSTNNSSSSSKYTLSELKYDDLNIIPTMSSSPKLNANTSRNSPKLYNNDLNTPSSNINMTSSNNNNNNNNNAILTSSGGIDDDEDDDFPMTNEYHEDGVGGSRHHHSTAHIDYHHHSSAVKDRECSSYADRVLFSNKYYYSYIFMILINLTLILWLIINLIKKNTAIPSHWLFITLDILVNITLAVEILLQVISQKKKYFQQWSNLFDLLVLVLSIAGLFMYFLASNSTKTFDFEGIFIILLTAIRYGVQFLRLLALIKRQSMKNSTFNSRIDFTELKESDLDFDIDSSDF
ncbi:hypothetical protein CYY_004723 [Polysphondylium violaceum]|uniref:Ion transport domain-containing protein n=1 Tax=Polysphondylium violaceum TaxID=133409 RepID=A0A8J4V059_9MYCE|nr:hypothetical protein CYY_004723 [Polysphondylium violaceum]